MILPLVSMLLTGSCIYATSSWNYGCYVFALPLLPIDLWLPHIVRSIIVDLVLLLLVGIITWFIIGAIIGAFVGYIKSRKTTINNGASRSRVGECGRKM